MIRTSSPIATAGSCSGRTAPACPRMPGRKAPRTAQSRSMHRDQRAHQDRAPVRRPGPAGVSPPGALDRQPVRRLPDRRDRQRPASACSAGKIPTPASTGWACYARARRPLARVLRNDGQSGDLVDVHASEGFELVCVTWGSRGATLHRNGTAAGSQKGIDAVSSDPAVAALRLGGPGSGGSPRFQGTSPRSASTTGNSTKPSAASSRPSCATWFDPTDPQPSPDRSPRRSSTTNCSRPEARSGSRRTSGRQCCRPKSDRELDESEPRAGRL